MSADLLSRLHYALIRGFIERGACPVNADLAKELRVSPSELEEFLREMAEIHGLVLHPHVCEPWVVHPFSTTPTIHWVEAPGRGWWAPCIWCALGVASLVGGDVRIHTRVGAEAEPLIIAVEDGEPSEADAVWVHFAIRPARAWDNVHQHCAMVLAFRSREEIREWCARHGVATGEAVPLGQVAGFAREWYGSHARPDWRKWTVPEAQEIFRRAGLVGEFWDLGKLSGRY